MPGWIEAGKAVAADWDTVKWGQNETGREKQGWALGVHLRVRRETQLIKYKPARARFISILAWLDCIEKREGRVLNPYELWSCSLSFCVCDMGGEREREKQVGEKLEGEFGDTHNNNNMAMECDKIGREGGGVREGGILSGFLQGPDFFPQEDASKWKL